MSTNEIQYNNSNSMTPIYQYIGDKILGIGADYNQLNRYRSEKVEELDQNENTDIDNQKRRGFWLYDPGSLIVNAGFTPNCHMTEQQRLNTLTWWILIIAFIFFFVGYGSWFIFLILGLALVIFLYFTNVVWT